MTTLTEGRHAGEFILSEAPGALSRENATLKAGQNLPAGAVLELDSGSFAAGDAVVKGFLGNTASVACGCLLDAVDATSAAKDCVVIARDAEVNTNMISVENDDTAETIKTAAIASLAASHIRAR